MADVTLRHVYKVYDGGVRAVNDFDLDIKTPENNTEEQGG